MKTQNHEMPVNIDMTNRNNEVPLEITVEGGRIVTVKITSLRGYTFEHIKAACDEAGVVVQNFRYPIPENYTTVPMPQLLIKFRLGTYKVAHGDDGDVWFPEEAFEYLIK